MEEMRQREANLTALAAIGPRKKKKPNEETQVGKPYLTILIFYGTKQVPTW